jgi:hypothetical protein
VSDGRRDRVRRRQRGSCGGEADAFRDVPRRRRGSARQDSAPAESCSRTKRSAPSRSRLRPAHPIDLRRSDCRAGVPSSFGAPCSVHSEIYWRIPQPSSAPNATRSQIATISSIALFRGGFALESVNSRKNAPRSVLPRPTNRPTYAEAFACRRAINLGRSFLGAPGTLDRGQAVVNQCRKREDRCLRFFLYKTHTLASSRMCSTSTGPRIRRAGCAFVHFPG